MTPSNVSIDDSSSDSDGYVRAPKTNSASNATNSNFAVSDLAAFGSRSITATITATAQANIGFQYLGMKEVSSTDYDKYTLKTQYSISESGLSNSLSQTKTIKQNLHGTSTNHYIYYIALFKPYEYKININVLDPEGNELYQSGEAGKFDLKIHTGKVYSNIYNEVSDKLPYKQIWTISNIRPGTGMHLKSVSCSNGTITNNNGTYTYQGNFSKNPNGEWDDTITIQMDWNDYVVSIDDKNTYSEEIRYIKDTLVNGSSANSSNHWLEIQAIGNDEINYAHKNYGAKSSNNFSINTTEALLNGNIGLDEWKLSGMSADGNSYQLIDLGQIRTIDNIVVWHYYGDYRLYSNNKLEVSVDGENWRTIFSTADCGTYVERESGHKVYVDKYRTKTVTYNSNYNTLPNPTKLGYLFKGWFITEDSQVINSTKVTTPNDHTLDAHWQSYQLTITYHDGTSLTNSNYDYESSKNVVLPTPTKTGYIFKGWKLNNQGNDLNGNQDFSNNITTSSKTIHLYANWEPIKYNIIYNLNGGKNGSSAPAEGTFDSVITIPNPEKIGYIFVGWTASGLDLNTAKYGANDALSTSWDGKTKVTMTHFKNLRSTSGIVTLTANWTANTYTVQYSGNGNTGGSTNSQTFTYDQTYSLQYNSFTRTGYIFICWNTKDDGTGKDYLAQQSVSNLSADPGATVTLYAKWQATWASSGIKQPTDQDSEGYYLISSAEELAWLAYQTENGKLGGKYKQITNIDLTRKTWLPIGRLNAFVGEYNGQGYKITGLKTSDAKGASSEFLESYGGLFGQLTNAPDDSIVKIYNVYIENANINGKTAGIIAGSVSDNVVIENCIVSGTVNGKTIGSVVGVGGQINNCLAINVNTSAMGNSATIQNCIYQLSSGTKGEINFSDYSGWGYNENLFYPIPTAITWYTYNPLTSLTLEEWLNK